MNELKPCPFCGGRESVGLTTVGNDNYVSCAKCGIRTHSGIGVNRTAEQVSKSWNRRALEPLSDPQPLTLSELRERDGEPYFHISLQGPYNGWRILDSNIAKRAENYNYGKTWLAYDRPPKENTHD